MVNYPLVSIITATYKKFERLYDTIQSVLNQDYPHIEYIISDDGSDLFPENEIQTYIETHKGNNIEKFSIIHHENWGTVKNLKEAAKCSGGRYVLMLSCNDIFYTDSTVSAIVQRFSDNKADLMVTSRLVYDATGDKRCLQPHYFERHRIQSKKTPYAQYRLNLSGRIWDMASGSAMSYSKSILEELGYFDEEYRFLEDGPFLEKYLWNHTLHFAYDIISIYYQDSGVSSGKDKSVNSIYLKDTDQFKFVQRFKHFTQLDHNLQRLLNYSKKNKYAKGREEKILLYLQYVDVFLLNAFHKILRRINCTIDYIIIRWKKM